MKAISILKYTLVAISVVAVLWLVACGAIYRAMRRPPEDFGRFMAKLPGQELPFLVLPFETLWMRARSGTLHSGDPAPDFTLSTLDKTSHVQLSALTAQGRPVVLIFGSYT